MSIKAAYILPHPPLAIPEVGRGQERMIKDTLEAFEAAGADLAAIRPDTCIFISPHSIIYRDYFHISPGCSASGSMAAFGVPDVSFETEYDAELVWAIAEECKKSSFPAGTDGERDRSLDHGTMVPMFFLNNGYDDYKSVRIGLSGLSLETHYEFGKIIKAVCDASGKNVVIIASGDLSHCQKQDGPYGYRPQGPEYDKRLMEALSGSDLRNLLSFDEELLEASMECGHRSFCIMAGAFDGQEVKADILSHEATFGVGYGVCILKPVKKGLKS